ncbi:hypothetical protein KM043_005083 [Ampulex compressa]|nr:hypothetical protein KM043_005083 [Ampulex compressa]
MEIRSNRDEQKKSLGSFSSFEHSLAALDDRANLVFWCQLQGYVESSASARFDTFSRETPPRHGAEEQPRRRSHLGGMSNLAEHVESSLNLHTPVHSHYC